MFSQRITITACQGLTGQCNLATVDLSGQMAVYVTEETRKMKDEAVTLVNTCICIYYGSPLAAVMLNSNGLTDIQPYAFNGTRLEEVYLYRNVDLVRLDERTFSGVISGPTLLDVSESRVNSLPTMGLEAVQKLKAKNTWALKKLPPLRAFQHLQSAELTYPSHCCGLSKVKRRRG
ncbi:unnamed protein product [Oncorhynchus mykiss]|uniref:Receptor L-domain domain-containing protein n=1 Tax=Oncorhynchus mykiss TaxID=8022 RepID=A0A060ZA07_ONCMY|nr:unnamed protein product [Oncorhynchus mykiss]